MEYQTPITITIPVSWKQRLVRLAQERTGCETKRISVADLVREALEEVFDLDLTPRTGGTGNEQ